MPQLDPIKSVKNIKANAYADNGIYDVICENQGCKVTAASSQLHGWETKKGFFCPGCKDKK